MATAVGYRVPPPTATRSRDPHPHRQTHVLFFGCAAVVAPLMCIGIPVSQEPLPTVQAVTVEPMSAAATGVTDEALALLRTRVEDARHALVASEGRVLDDAARTELGDTIRKAQDAVREAQLLGAIAAPGAMPDPGTGVTKLRALGVDLEAATVSVGTAVAAWETEQARIAAAQEAARLAAEAAAASRARVTTSAVGAAGVAGPYVEGIWTSGGQAEIDACRGSVNLPDVAGYLGGGFYAAEHWSCGGRAWSAIETGSLVSFPGYGLFEVVGRVGGLPSGSYASSLPGGYDGYYQTCMNGDVNNLHVWLLTRVG